VSNPDRILIVRLSHLGDVVHALGVFHALHAAYPRAAIAWAIQEEFAELVAPLPGLARVLVFRRRGGPLAWWRLRRSLREFAPDWTIDAQGNAKSAAASWLSGARRRSAPARSDWQEPWAAWTAGEHGPASSGPHAMDRMAAIAAHVAPSSGDLRLDAALSAEEERAGTSALEAHLPRAGDAPVLLHLSSTEDVRAWPVEHWRELARGLRAAGRGVLVLSGPAERRIGEELARHLAPDPGITHWIGQRGLRALAGVFAAAARRGVPLVACDSGPMHLAAAHGVRVVVLEGPQDAARTGPWAPPAGRVRHGVVRNPDGPACAPCLRRTCGHPEGPVCLRGLRPEAVLAALEGA